MCDRHSSGSRYPGHPDPMTSARFVLGHGGENIFTMPRDVPQPVVCSGWLPGIPLHQPPPVKLYWDALSIPSSVFHDYSRNIPGCRRDTKQNEVAPLYHPKTTKANHTSHGSYEAVSERAIHGKAPNRHLGMKACKLTPATGGIQKPHRYRPGTIDRSPPGDQQVPEEHRAPHTSSPSSALFAKSPRTSSRSCGSSPRRYWHSRRPARRTWSACSRTLNICALHAKRITIMPKDMQLARRIRGERS